MKALMKVASGPGNLELVEVPEPSCGKSLVIVEFSSFGIYWRIMMPLSIPAIAFAEVWAIAGHCCSIDIQLCENLE